jgi:hypothetical protein
MLQLHSRRIPKDPPERLNRRLSQQHLPKCLLIKHLLERKNAKIARQTSLMPEATVTELRVPVTITLRKKSSSHGCRLLP